MKKGERSKEKIIQTAQQVLFCEENSAFSVSEIAARAGIAKGTFYHHFKHKQELIKEVAVRRMQVHLAELTSIVNDEQTPYLTRFSRCILRAAELSEYYDRLQKQSGLSYEQYEQYLDQFILQTADAFAPFLEEGVRIGCLRVKNVRISYLIFAFGLRILRNHLKDEETGSLTTIIYDSAQEVFHIHEPFECV